MSPEVPARPPGVHAAKPLDLETPIPSLVAMAAEGGVSAIDVEAELDAHRRELTGYCYRMLGSGAEAEDAVQETLVRAWKAADGFEGRSSVRSWLYRIATNVCIDMHRSPQRRARPMDLGPASTVETAVLDTRPEATWLQPVPDERVLDLDGDPAGVAAARESIRLAFVAALQHLPAKQRAVLILCEVLRWQASEAAELLETTVASVNSALQRARATLAVADVEQLDSTVDPEHQELLARYVDAFERYDMDALTAILRDDAVISMPPFDLWLRGADQVVGWMIGPGIACKGSRLVPMALNGSAGFAQYKPGDSGRLEPWAIQVIEARGGRISAHHNFVFPELFAQLGLPAHLDP
jgi:RNA polymerase sigma-70 factor, ECF subfamily